MEKPSSAAIMLQFRRIEVRIGSHYRTNTKREHRTGNYMCATAQPYEGNLIPTHSFVCMHNVRGKYIWLQKRDKGPIYLGNIRVYTASEFHSKLV